MNLGASQAGSLFSRWASLAVSAFTLGDSCAGIHGICYFNPLERLTEFLYYATHPSLQSIVFISVFSTFFIFFYITIYAFGLLLQEQAQPIPQEIS